MRKELVPGDKMIDGEVPIRCAHGDVHLYPLAQIEIEIGDSTFAVEAGVTDQLPVSVLLGKDIPELMELLEQPKGVNALVVTRAQAEKQRREEARIEEREKLSGAQPKPVLEEEESELTQEERRDESELETEVDEMEKLIAGLDEEMFQGGREKEKQTRRQKRVERQKHAEQKNLHPLDISLREIQELQENDETLEVIRRAVDGESNLAGIGYFKREGLIYKTPRTRQGRYDNRAAGATQEVQEGGT